METRSFETLWGGKALTIETGKLAGLANPLRGAVKPGTEPGLEATEYFGPSRGATAAGCHAMIVEVDPDCACTVPKYDKSIPPGGEGGITLTIKPFSVLHRFKKETKVRLNDPDQPVLYLTMTGVAQPFIEIKPSHIVRLRDVPGDDVRGQVRFISNLLTPFKITEYRTNIPDKIELTLKPEVPDKVYVLEVRPKEQVSGAFAGVIELFTNSKERPRLIVRVFGEIYRPSAGGQ